MRREFGFELINEPLVLDLKFYIGTDVIEVVEPYEATKHLQDMLFMPTPDSGLKREDLVFLDDEQVKILGTTSYYGHGNEQSSVVISATTLSAFKKDLSFVSRVARGDFEDQKDLIEATDVNELIHELEPDLNEYEDLRYEELKDLYATARRNQDSWRERYGPEAYETIEREYLLESQKKLLQLSRPSISQWSSLLRVKRFPRILPSIRHEFGIDDDFFKKSEEQTRTIVLSSPIALNLYQRPQRRGPTRDRFAALAEGAARDLIDRFPTLRQPQLQLDLTVFIVQPTNEKTKDLDNLGSLVVNAIVGLLKPPATIVGIPGSSDEILAPKYAFRSVQVIELPRHPEHPDEGFVRLLISGGDILSDSLIVPNIERIVSRLIWSWS